MFRSGLAFGLGLGVLGGAAQAAPSTFGIPSATDAYALGVVDRADLDAPGEVGVRLDLGYARAPLRLGRTTAIDDELRLGIALHVGVLRGLEAGLAVPVSAASYGSAGAEAAGGAAAASAFDLAAGDLSVFVKAAATRRWLSGAVLVRGFAPTGDRSSFRSDGVFGAELRLLVDLRWRRLEIVAGAGARLHPTIHALDASRQALFTIGPELTYQAALLAPLGRTLGVALELVGNEPLLGRGATAARISAVVGSLRLALAPSSVLLVGVGHSLTASARSDDLRLLVGLAWRPLRARPHESQSPSADVETARELPDGPGLDKDNSVVVDLVPPEIDADGLAGLPAIIRFPPRSARLDPAARRTIVALAAMLTDRPDLALVRLEGHAERHEPNPEQLALARARAVARELVRRGVAAPRVSSAGWGARRPAETPKLSRRVEWTASLPEEP